MNSDLVVAKAAGKVLIAGGYGVLEDQNFGLCLSVANYFYCTCTHYQASPKTTRILIESHQIGQKWEYYNKQEQLVEVNGKANNFVQCALFWALKYFNKTESAGIIKLDILFTRNFISDNDAMDETEFPTYRSGYTKTGLGSSACVIVSIVQCLIFLFEPKLKQQNVILFEKIVNMISQLSNLTAQKKIGSNFDISTAIFGSHLYQNLLPHQILLHLKDMDLQQMKQLLLIDPNIQMLGAPSCSICSYIVDMKQGADTRTMVKSFMTELKKCSQEVQKEFFASSKAIALQLFDIWQQGKFKECRVVNKKHRSLQQKYSEITGVPIEPSSLSPVIDRIFQIPHVLYAICPGSGGFDAVFVLALHDTHKQLAKAVGGNLVRRLEILYGTEKLREVSKQEKKLIMDVLSSRDSSSQKQN